VRGSGDVLDAEVEMSIEKIHHRRRGNRVQLIQDGTAVTCIPARLIRTEGLRQQ
jgi:hypothetical protein